MSGGEYKLHGGPADGRMEYFGTELPVGHTLIIRQFVTDKNLRTHFVKHRYILTEVEGQHLFVFQPE